MKLFQDCEISRQHLRGHAAVVIVGNRAVTAAEAASLRAEFIGSFGTKLVPMYFSKDGWQSLDAPAKPARTAAPAPAKPATPAAKEAA